MALTAAHAELGVLDVTEFAASRPADWWHTVHRTGEPLTCRACAAPVDAVHAPSNRHRPFYFRHQAASACWLSAGESAEHHQLKLLLANLVRTMPGWNAELEVSGHGWRADVLADGPTGRRIAFEAQLAAVSAREIKDRSETYAAAGIEVCWVTLHRRGWFGAAPSLLIEPGSDGTWTVVDGARALPRQPLVDLHARRFDLASNTSGKPFLVTCPQAPAWTWQAILASGTVPERLASTRQPWRFGLWLHRRAKVAWRPAKPVPLAVVLASIMQGRTVPVELDGPCLDYGKPRLATAWVRRADADTAAPLVAFAYGWPVVPAPTTTCSRCRRVGTLLLFGGTGWTVPLCPGCDRQLHELASQLSFVEHQEFTGTAAVQVRPVAVPDGGLVLPRRHSRSGPEPLRLIW